MGEDATLQARDAIPSLGSMGAKVADTWNKFKSTANTPPLRRRDPEAEAAAEAEVAAEWWQKRGAERLQQGV